VPSILSALPVKAVSVDGTGVEIESGCGGPTPSVNVDAGNNRKVNVEGEIVAKTAIVIHRF
jgi:hypothetical protein